MKPYDDLLLLPTEQTIRLLKLNTGSDRSAPLVAELFVISLDTNPQYACVSYCWGPTVFSHTITCNNTVLNITENLGLALSSIRSMSDLPLWADQLCINQHDVQERSIQVSCMKKIYSQAAATYIYLGEPDSDATHDACRVLRTLSLPVTTLTTKDEGPIKTKLLHLRGRAVAIKVAIQHPRLAMRAKDEDVKGAISLLSLRPYFSRKWIIQEVTMSRTLFCVLGTHRFESVGLLQSVSNANAEIEPGTNFGPEHLRSTCHVLWLTSLHLDHEYQRPNPLLTLLYYARLCKVTDPRDHVFALLGAASDTDDFPKPDYGLSVEQVYHNTSSCFIRQGNGLVMLRLAGIRMTDNGLPSWVVDWRGLDSFYPCNYFASFRAGGTGDCIRLGADAATICAAGRVVDRVDAIGNPFTAGTSLWDRLAQYIDDCTHAFEEFYETKAGKLAIQEDLASLICFDMQYDNGDKNEIMFRFNKEQHGDFLCHDFTAFGEICDQLPLLCARYLQGKMGKWFSGNGQRTSTGGLYRLCQKLMPVKSPRALAEHRVMKGLVKNSLVENLLRLNLFHPTTRPIMTHNRRLGLAPVLTRIGDAVCVLSGANAPFILRPSGDGSYRIVGEAYVRDIMFGETLNDDAYPLQEFLIR